MAIKTVEIWADSFHEGVWCCDNICSFLKSRGYTFTLSFVNGFIPAYQVFESGTQIAEFYVYGSYKTWALMPQTIKGLIEWGKPDFIAYDPANDEIWFAVEETAAVPTGNQAMQRCERQYGSARAQVPYWYFVSEFGEHVDGGVRRDNIWPTIAAIKLTLTKKIPSIVLHYSDIDRVEDYNSGKGLALLFDTLSRIIDNKIHNRAKFDGIKNLIAQQYSLMIEFLLSQWDNVIKFLPTETLLKDPNTPSVLAEAALNLPNSANSPIKDKLLVWPLTTGVPQNILQDQHGKDLIKYDALSEKLENDVTNHKCYILSDNAGSGKPPLPDKIEEWVRQQARLSLRGIALTPPAPFVMKPSDFPDTDSGRKHITTAKNIVYLYDRWADLRNSIESAYPRLKGKFTGKLQDDSPVFLYLSNTVKPGRLFGDPFTGQLSAFSTAFGKFDKTQRKVIIYFPHQVYTQAFKSDWTVEKNKGTTLFSELTDFIIFNAGVAVSLSTGDIL